MIFQLDLNMLNVYTDKTSSWNKKTSEMLKQSGTELSPAPAWEKEVQAIYSCEKHPYFDTIS